MRAVFFAGLVLAVLASTTSATAIEGQDLPAPGFEPSELNTQRDALLEQSRRDHADSLLQQQLRQLELLQQQAQRDKARAKKLKQLKGKQQS